MSQYVYTAGILSESKGEGFLKNLYFKDFEVIQAICYWVVPVTIFSQGTSAHFVISAMMMMTTTARWWSVAVATTGFTPSVRIWQVSRPPKKSRWKIILKHKFAVLQKQSTVFVFSSTCCTSFASSVVSVCAADWQAVLGALSCWREAERR